MEPAVEFPSWTDAAHPPACRPSPVGARLVPASHTSLPGLRAALPVQRATTRIFVFNHFDKIESVNGSN